jgi:drug/metabolite transporter (DMT)-like permease
MKSAESRASGAPPEHNVQRGLILVLLAMVILPGQDTIAKFLSGTVSPGQVTWARFLMQTLLTLPFLLLAQGLAGLRPNRLWPNLVRGALIASSSFCFFLAISVMPLADAIAIFFVEPFILTLLSALVEKEPIGWRRLAAVAAGFVGVIIVVQPSWDVFGPVSLLPALAGLLFAIYVILNRRQSAYDTPLTMQFTAGLAAFIIASLVMALAPAFDWPMMQPSAVGGRELVLLLLMGIFGTGGHMLFVQGSRHAPSAVVAPLQYVEIVFAALLGYLVFGDFPRLDQWAGIGIIVGSGAYVLWRESLRR